MNFYLLLLSFFLIALVYSSVGFGGGSSYLAILGQSIFSLGRDNVGAAALLCNIVVVTGGTIIFYKEGKISWRESWPFLAASVPLAFLGGFWRLDEQAFFILLGVTLTIASVFIWVKLARLEQPSPYLSTTWAKSGIGGGIGLLSGMVRIGGGIFLSPLLHLLNWNDTKRISALASLFILVNSISGLAGQFARSTDLDWNFIWPLLVAVLLGGQLGSRLGARTFNPLYIKRITAVLIFIAGLNILRDHLT